MKHEIQCKCPECGQFVKTEGQPDRSQLRIRKHQCFVNEKGEKIPTRAWLSAKVLITADCNGSITPCVWTGGRGQNL